MIGMIIGVAVALSANAYARSDAATRVGPPCESWTPRGYICYLPTPSGRTVYEIQVKGMDLSCDLRVAFPGQSPDFYCGRTSRPVGSCIDGLLASTSADITSTKVEIMQPLQCVHTPGALPKIT